MKSFKVLIAMFFLATFAQAQNFIEVTEASYSGFSEKEESVFNVEVNRVKRDALMKHWAKYLESASDHDPVVTETKLTISKVVLEKISTKPLNIFMQFEDLENGVRVFIGVQDSIDGFIGPSNSVYGISLTNLIKEQTTKVYLTAKKDDIDKEEGLLKDLQKELKGAIKDKEKISKNVVKNQRNIDKLKQEITYNTSLLETLQKMVTDKKMKYNSLPNSASKDEKKALKNELKSAEKEYDKTVSSIDKATEDVFDEEAEIREMNLELETVEKQIADIQEKVNKQDAFVRALQNQVFEVEKK